MQRHAISTIALVTSSLYVADALAVMASNTLSGVEFARIDFGFARVPLPAETQYPNAKVVARNTVEGVLFNRGQ